MNRVQKWIAFASICALALVVVFPPWIQTYNGHPLAYNEQLGHHALWSPPPATGENSWILKVAAAECEVTINRYALIAQCGLVIAISTILLLVFRRVRTIRSTVYISVLVALCLPVPWFGSVPLLVWVVGGLLAPLSDTGHLNPFALFFLGVGFLVFYSAIMFVLLRGLFRIAYPRERE